MPQRGEGLICCEEKCRGGLGYTRHCFLLVLEASLGLLPAGLRLLTFTPQLGGSRSSRSFVLSLT